jgi:hypothetical protein
VFQERYLKTQRGWSNNAADRATVVLSRAPVPTAAGAERVAVSVEEPETNKWPHDAAGASDCRAAMLCPHSAMANVTSPGQSSVRATAAQATRPFTTRCTTAPPNHPTSPHAAIAAAVCAMPIRNPFRRTPGAEVVDETKSADSAATKPLPIKEPTEYKLSGTRCAGRPMSRHMSRGMLTACRDQ